MKYQLKFTHGEIKSLQGSEDKDVFKLMQSAQDQFEQVKQYWMDKCWCADPRLLWSAILWSQSIIGYVDFAQKNPEYQDSSYYKYGDGYEPEYQHFWDGFCTIQVKP